MLTFSELECQVAELMCKLAKTKEAEGKEEEEEECY